MFIIMKNAARRLFSFALLLSSLFYAEPCSLKGGNTGGLALVDGSIYNISRGKRFNGLLFECVLDRRVVLAQVFQSSRSRVKHRSSHRNQPLFQHRSDYAKQPLEQATDSVSAL